MTASSRLVLFVALVLLPAVAAAQAPQAAPPPAAPPAPPPAVTGSAMVGASFETGSTNLYGASVVLTLGVRKSERTNYSVEFDAAHASTKPAGAARRLTLSDSQILHFKFEHDAARRLVVIAQTTGTRDKVRRIRHRVEQFAGAGLSLGAQATRRLRVIPVVALNTQEKNVEREANFQAGVGLVQDLTVKINAMWSFDQDVLYRQYFDNDDDFALNASAALTGRITERLGLQLSYVRSHENFVAPGTIKHHQKIQAGLNYTF